MVDLNDISVSTAGSRNIGDNTNTPGAPGAPGASAENSSIATFALEVANLDGVSTF